MRGSLGGSARAGASPWQAAAAVVLQPLGAGSARGFRRGRREIQPLEVPADDAPSALSQHLRGMKESPCIETRTMAALADYVDDTCRSMHEVSEQHRPRTTAPLTCDSSKADRLETLAWLLQALHAMSLADECLFDSSSLLDRYYVLTAHEETRDGSSQHKLLAAVMLALKKGTEQDLKCPLRELIYILGRQQVPIKEVLKAEQQMLVPLGFIIDTPTPYDFLSSLGLRLAHRPQCTMIADFLLHLSLADAELLYRYPHCVMAAAALALSLHTLRAEPEVYEQLLQDLRLHDPDGSEDIVAQVLPCCHELHGLWRRSLDRTAPDRMHSYTKHVVRKFSLPQPGMASAAQLHVTAPLTLPPRVDLEDAVALLADIEVLEDDDHGGEHRDAALLAKLRNLAETSQPLRSVLTRHGWTDGRFRRTPDRQRLLLELGHLARAPHELTGPKNERPASASSTSSTQASTSFSLASTPLGSTSMSSTPLGCTPMGARGFTPTAAAARAALDAVLRDELPMCGKDAALGKAAESAWEPLKSRSMLPSLGRAAWSAGSSGGAAIPAPRRPRAFSTGCDPLRLAGASLRRSVSGTKLFGIR